jgi:hypothetical protein
MQSSIVLALRSRTRHDDAKAIGFEQHVENVTKSLVILDQEDDMHRIGHAVILIDRTEILLKMQNSADGCDTKEPRGLYQCRPESDIYTKWYFAERAVARRLPLFGTRFREVSVLLSGAFRSVGARGSASLPLAQLGRERQNLFDRGHAGSDFLGPGVA